MVISKTLSKLTYNDLKNFPAWAAIGDYAEDEDAKLIPVTFDDSGLIPSHLEDVWCLCNATFANGTEHLCTAMCRGDSPDGPLLWSIWNGNEDVPLLLPPAPPPVLAKRGPDFFSSKFDLDTDDVFPIEIEVIPRFAISPKVRRIKLGLTGVL